jgi:hypothetical protein
MGIDQARNIGHLLLQERRDLFVVLAVTPLHLHIDLRGYAEVQHLRHHVGRLEIEEHVGEGDRQFGAQLLDDLGGGLMLVAELDLNDPVIDPYGAAIGKREVVDA